MGLQRVGHDWATSLSLSMCYSGFPCGSAGKESACYGFNPWVGKIPWRRERLPLQYSGLENSVDCIVHGVSKNQTRLSNFHFTSVLLISVGLFLTSSKNIDTFLHTDPVKSESCSVVSDSLRPHELYSPRNSPGQNTRVGSLSLLLGIFPTQESNPGLPHSRRILYQVSYQGSPKY